MSVYRVDTTTKEQEHQQRQQHQKQYVNLDNIYTTSSVWLSGSKNRKRPTIYLPEDLANDYRMAEPCRIGFFAQQDGILIKFLHPLPRHKHKRHNNNEDL